jgi:hypothetical protein
MNLREIDAWLVDKTKTHDSHKIPIVVKLGEHMLVINAIGKNGEILSEIVLVHENGKLKCSVYDESSCTRDIEPVFSQELTHDLKF